jgi:hypothetical protein
MNLTPCDLETDVLRACMTGRWSDDLRRHATECPSCSELVLVTQSLRRHASSVEAELPLPDPGFLWWRAQLQSRAAAAERATRMIVWVQRVAIASCATLVALALLQLWPTITGWLSSIASHSMTSSLPANVARPGLVIGASLVVLALLLAYDSYEPRTGR